MISDQAATKFAMYGRRKVSKESFMRELGISAEDMVSPDEHIRRTAGFLKKPAGADSRQHTHLRRGWEEPPAPEAADACSAEQAEPAANTALPPPRAADAVGGDAVAAPRQAEGDGVFWRSASKSLPRPSVLGRSAAAPGGVAPQKAARSPGAGIPPRFFS
ncbi:hypothetical protein DIPPA_00623 [Diplonema papillatum]|nr:hypothetical protein DIPPA_00623 [Diplonema papillatum]